MIPPLQQHVRTPKRRVRETSTNRVASCAVRKGTTDAQADVNGDAATLFFLEAIGINR